MDSFTTTINEFGMGSKMLTFRGFFCTQDDVQDIMACNVYTSTLLDIYSTIIRDKTDALGLDNSKQEIFGASIFVHVFRHPLEVPDASCYMLYQHLHGQGTVRTDITIIYVPQYNCDHWHLIMVSIWDKLFFQCISRFNIKCHTIEFNQMSNQME